MTRERTYEELHPDGVCRHEGTRHRDDGSVDCPLLRPTKQTPREAAEKFVSERFDYERGLIKAIVDAVLDWGKQVAEARPPSTPSHDEFERLCQRSYESGIAVAQVSDRKFVVGRLRHIRTGPHVVTWIDPKRDARLGWLEALDEAGRQMTEREEREAAAYRLQEAK